MWGVVTYWNPLAFAGMWTGAALVMWGLSSRGYPGALAHAKLALLSIPVWWWFELVNARTQNWRYVYVADYSATEFAVLSSIAFATVIPAVVAAYALTRRLIDREEASPAPETARNGGGRSRSAPGIVGWLYLFFAGLLLQALVFAFPVLFYPFVWVAPFLVVDALLARAGGPSLVVDLRHGRLRDAIAIGAAGLLCGALWEFLNFWSTPRWEYSVPLLGFWKVFEMPLLGYSGYIPFAWTIVQLVRPVEARPSSTSRGARSGSLLRGPPGLPL